MCIVKSKRRVLTFRVRGSILKAEVFSSIQMDVEERDVHKTMRRRVQHN